jgi:hypothetical protein
MKRALSYFAVLFTVVAVLLVVIGLTSTVSAIAQSSKTANPAQKQPPQKAPSPPSKRVLTLRKVIGSDAFGKLASTAFSGAYFKVNSCGGADAARTSKIFVSGVYQKIEPLARLDSQLPQYVLDETLREEISYSKNPPMTRDAKLRACVDNIRTYQWKGTVEGGRFKIQMQFNSNLFIKTRKMEEEKKSGGWKDRFDWNDPLADKDIPDYFYVAPCLDVYLSPVLQAGMVSYAQIEVKWSWFEDKGFVWPENALVGDPFKTPYGHPEEKEIILEYKADVMKILADRMSRAFGDPPTRKHLTAALTGLVKSGDLANREIIEVSGRGSTVSVQFK